MALRDCKFERTYKTDEVGNDGMGHFYQAALKNSVKWRAASGYFTSSFLELFKKEVLQFVIDGGKIELVCSQVLKEDDIEKIENGYLLRYSIYNEIIENVLQEMIDNEDHKDAIGFLATLIKFEKLDIKIDFYKKKKGIMHLKSGYFSDINNEDAIAYSGSGNVTYMGAGEEGNFEMHLVFKSWDERDRYQDIAGLVDEMWENKRKDHDVIDFPEVAKDRLWTYSKNNLAELDAPNIEKYNYSSASQNSDPGTKVALKKRKLDNLFPHQEETVENWYKNSQRGIIKHATGVGKTITAIKIIDDHVKQGKPALVIVPSVLLLDQWYEEMKNEIPTAGQVLCGGGNRNWEKQNFYYSLQTSSNASGIIILSVIDTAATEKFINKISEGLEDLLIVFDEVHRVATKTFIRLLGLEVPFRLAMSATPEIYSDEENYYDRILEYFKQILEPEISLKKAIEMGRLCRYQYEPNFVYLTDDEENEWMRISNQIRKLSAFKNKDDKTKKNMNEDKIKLLRIQRARVIKKAENKVSIIEDILATNYRNGQFWLIYCQDSEQLEKAEEILQRMDIDSNFYKYISDQKNRIDELDHYKSVGGILLAIDCLDEGIDIPQITHAIILASSQNPRQFVQRRGRVLRKSHNKDSAVIFDCFIRPKDNYENFSGIMKNEIERAKEMADAAINSVSVIQEITSILAPIKDFGVRYLFQDDDIIEDELEQDI